MACSIGQCQAEQHCTLGVVMAIYLYSNFSNTIHLPFLMEYFVVDFVIPSTTQRSTTVLYNWKLPVAICLPHPSYQGGHGKQTEARPLKF
jgi:hypothetical protein